MLLSFAYRTSSIPRFTITSHSAEQPQHAPGKVLLVLPKDTAPDRDYGFDAGWLDMAISNRGEYAKYHRMFGITVGAGSDAERPIIPLAVC